MIRTDAQRLRDARDRAAIAFETVQQEGFDEVWRSRQARQSILLDIILIGEALGPVSNAVRGLAPTIPWRSIRGTRNRLVHEYWLHDASILANLLVDDLPPLIVALDELVAVLEREA